VPSHGSELEFIRIINMHVSCMLFTLATTAQVLGLSIADGQVHKRQTACGIFVAPSSIFTLDESQPDAFLPVTDGIFQLSQEAGMSEGT
jgi:hypothetical protein